MSVLVYAEEFNGKFAKSTLEAVSYARELSNSLGTELRALCSGNFEEGELRTLSNYGANKVLVSDKVCKADGGMIASLIEKQINDSDIIVFASTNTTKMISPRLAVKLSAGVANNVVETPSSITPFIVKKKSFSGKAYENIEIKTDKKIISIAPNSYGAVESIQEHILEEIDFSCDSNIIIDGEEVISGKINLSEANIIVSAGRGMKDPKNWDMIEELANLLEAATACSKPVSDMGWRPHSEHVGQTGKTVAPDLYIAIGISGAIQHLAGVNSSKIMVAINTDQDAPFFKAADYGIVGDAFDVVPRLIEEIKKIKN